MKKILFLVSILFLSAGCDKDPAPAGGGNDPGGTTSLSIASVSPTAAEAGTKVVITGTGFSTVPAENIIKFGGIQALTDSASTTRLVTKVPVGAATGKISVEVKGKTVASSAEMTINTGNTAQSDGRLFLSSGTFISCVDVVAKKMVWQYNTNQKSVAATIRIDKQTLYASLIHNSAKEVPEIVALNAETGSKKWTYALSGPLTTLVTDVHVSGSTIAFCSREPYNNKSFTVYGLSASDGKLKWSKKLNADNFTACKYIKTNDKQVFVAHSDGITCFDSESGNVMWESASQKMYPREGNIQVTEDAVVIIDYDQIITCFEAVTGKVRWRSKEKYYYINGLISFDKKIIAPNELTDKINVLNASDGKLIREINLPAEYFYERAFINEGKLYRVNMGGGLSIADIGTGETSVLGAGKTPGNSILRIGNTLYEFSGTRIIANTISNNTWSPVGFNIELDKIYPIGIRPPRITCLTKTGQVIYPVSVISSY